MEEIKSHVTGEILCPKAAGCEIGQEGWFSEFTQSNITTDVFLSSPTKSLRSRQGAGLGLYTKHKRTQEKDPEQGDDQGQADYKGDKRSGSV